MIFSSQKRSTCGTCFRENSREKKIVLAREFFTSRTKTKIFTRHVFSAHESKKSRS
ncbi:MULTISPECIES: DUF1661 domain-containing protein [Porphyromonas]|uniref:DUF1661 domain-containing protein n=1 Tax=Porphyromonas TaxID=836 RepID=UPI001F31FD1F|nr:DUF1661 domain-containing protein [Porphyromonas gulae]